MFKIISCCALSVFFLTGCTAQQMSSNPRSIVIENATSFNNMGQNIADEHCSRHGRYAIHRPDNIRDGRATFECIK
jgi:hypothetical protein